MNLEKNKKNKLNHPHIDVFYNGQIMLLYGNECVGAIGQCLHSANHGLCLRRHIDDDDDDDDNVYNIAMQ